MSYYNGGKYNTTSLSKAIELIAQRVDPNVCKLKKNYLGGEKILLFLGFLSW